MQVTKFKLCRAPRAAQQRPAAGAPAVRRPHAGGLSGEVFIRAPNVAGPVGVKAGVSLSRSDRLDDNASFGGLGTLGDFKRDFGLTETGSATVFSLDGTYSLGQ